jgi:hypothetical protein
MPALPSTALGATLLSRNAIATAVNATTEGDQALQVVCAFPVSGQYGPGSRVLYCELPSPPPFQPFNRSRDLRKLGAGATRKLRTDSSPIFCTSDILIAACVVGKDLEWLRNACLAAALLFPAVAALHGIVLAALHLDSRLWMPLICPTTNKTLKMLSTWMCSERSNYAP